MGGVILSRGRGLPGLGSPPQSQSFSSSSLARVSHALNVNLINLRCKVLGLGCSGVDRSGV